MLHNTSEAITPSISLSAVFMANLTSPRLFEIIGLHSICCGQYMKQGAKLCLECVKKSQRKARAPLGGLLHTLLATVVVFHWISGGWLGVMVQDLTPQLAARHGLRIETGVMVTRVQFNSPAMRGGVQEGDVVVSVNGKQIPDSETLKQVVTRLAPGKPIDLVVLREGGETTLQIVLGEIPRDAV